MNGLETLTNLLTAGITQVVIAIVVYFIGKAIIKRIAALIEKTKWFNDLDPSVRSFASSFIRGLLYVLLVIAVIGVLGIPMASVITVLATAGVAVGLALQGSLSNLAGGIMLLILKPFRVGDYVSVAGGDGTVKEINMFYTVLTTVDHKTITIPNGSLMGANVVNFSVEPTRRVDLNFACAKGEDIDLVQNTMLEVMNQHEKVLKDPAPFARLSGGTETAMEFVARAWVESANYWDVYFDLTNQITKALGTAGVHAPAARIITEEKKEA